MPRASMHWSCCEQVKGWGIKIERFEAGTLPSMPSSHPSLTSSQTPPLLPLPPHLWRAGHKLGDVLAAHVHDVPAGAQCLHISGKEDTNTER